MFRPRPGRMIIQIFAEAFPRERHRLVERRFFDVLDLFEHLDQLVLTRWTHGSQAEGAVAHDDGRHAMLQARRRQTVPADLGIVVGVDVDEAWAEHMALRVDLTSAFGGDLADCRDPAVLDAHVPCRTRQRPFRRPRARSGLRCPCLIPLVLFGRHGKHRGAGHNRAAGADLAPFSGFPVAGNRPRNNMLIAID